MMRYPLPWILITCLVGSCLFFVAPIFGSISSGSKAPIFRLKDAFGRSYDLASMQDQPMIMLYFFATESKSSYTALHTLNKLCTQYKDADLQVWAITKSTRAKVEAFISNNPIKFPVLIDSGAVSKSYMADRILPTTCILGPDLKVLDLLHGGGKSTEILLVRLAQRSLQRRNNDFARAVSETVVKSDPENVPAKIIKGFAALNQGELDASKIVFAELAQKSGEAQLAGKEGLSAVAAKNGQIQKALTLVDQVEQADPSRGLVNLIKADLLYSQNEKQAAEKEYQKAITKKNTPPRHRAKAYNQLGRIRADQGQLEQSKSLYDQAVAIDPYYIEATANKGLIYEKEGRWDQALASYNKALSIDNTDMVTLALQKKLLASMEREQKRINENSVDDLIKSMQEASIAFNTPKAMNLKDAIIINLILDINKTPDELAKVLEAVGEKESAVIKVAGRMQAQLIAKDFDITAIRPEIQAITSSDITKWEWEIRPKTAGRLTLYLSLNALFEVNGSETPHAVETFKRKIEIKVTWLQSANLFWFNNWKWIITTVLIPVLLLTWKQYKKTNKP